MTNKPYKTDERGVVEVLDWEQYTENHPNADLTTCGACGRTWDDAVVTSCTPAPSARCPFEYDHVAQVSNELPGNPDARMPGPDDLLASFRRDVERAAEGDSNDDHIEALNAYVAALESRIYGVSR